MRSTRFLIMSDTHDQDLFPANDTTHAFREPLPKADVLLHCGDLTMVGGLNEYRRALLMLSKVDAELKLVIAGNHDLSLDKDYWDNSRNSHDDPDDHDMAVEMWKGDAAKKAGVTYLEEGMHTFTLKSGVSFTVSFILVLSLASTYSALAGSMKAYPFEPFGAFELTLATPDIHITLPA